jgi:hypothetical protein
MKCAILAAVLTIAGCGGSSNPCRPLTTEGRLNCPDPHPPGWANDVGAGPQAFHGDAARRETSCGGCHDRRERELCTTCHRSNGPGSAGIGGGIHLPDFTRTFARSDIGKDTLIDAAGGVFITCLGCHTNG